MVVQKKYFLASTILQGEQDEILVNSEGHPSHFLVGLFGSDKMGPLHMY